MPTSFPTSVKTFTTKVDDVDDVQAEHVNSLQEEVVAVETFILDNGVFHALTTPLSSTDWDGDSYSTTAKTKIDLSAVFSAPADIKAIVVRISARDSESATATAVFGISPNDTSNQVAMSVDLSGEGDDTLHNVSGICPCDVNGDIYYQIYASTDNTLDAWIDIWGYWL